jgi:hypothetical protein
VDILTLPPGLAGPDRFTLRGWRVWFVTLGSAFDPALSSVLKA